MSTAGHFPSASPLQLARVHRGGSGRNHHARNTTGELTVTDVTGTPGQNQRLAELGIRIGANVELLQRASGGGVILGVGSSRVALDRRTSEGIWVVANT